MHVVPPEACVAVRRVGSPNPSADVGANPVVASETPVEGEVVAVGPGAEFLPPEVKVGDRVFFSRGIGTEVMADGEALLIMPEADLLCVIAKTAARNAA